MIAHVIPQGDLLLVSGTTSVIDAGEFAAQRIRTTLNVFLGEWFLDLKIGIPYFRDLLIHSPNSDTVITTFRTAIMNTPGIVSVPELTVDLDTTARIATVNFTAIYESGAAISQAVELVI